MKKQKGRYNNKVDKRIIISSNGTECSSIARASKENWDFWNFSLSLELNDIKALINTRRKQIKHIDNQVELQKCRNQLSLLSDALKIIKRNKQEKLIQVDTDEVAILGSTLLDRLGFTSNTLYKQEVNNILHIMLKYSIIDVLEDLNIQRKMLEEYVATSIVMEIFDYYGVHTNDAILEIYSLDTIDFYRLHSILHNWCNKCYWNKV